MRVEKPKPGLWHLSTSSSGSHTLRITGYSSLHFFSGFGLRPIRSPEEAAHRPVAGNYDTNMLAKLSVAYGFLSFTIIV